MTIFQRPRFMSAHQHAAESGISIATKAAPPVSVSLATVFGAHVNEVLIWATLIYTLLMIAHKIYAIYKDIRRKD
jgi:hypothetical protein